MKFELSYGQEETYLSQIDKGNRYPPYLLDTETANRGNALRKKASYNTIVFTSVSDGLASSISTDFILASKVLYRGELSKLGCHFSRFISDVEWPGFDTVDPCYLIQLMNGVIRTCCEDVEGVALLNLSGFLSGKTPVFLLVQKSHQAWLPFGRNWPDAEHMSDIDLRV
ncbi:TPA_asm: hypothetical protein [ssRNA phage Zoerhiza.1_27]|uniref:Uncharacterized protein n=2 Tax=Norzivirales TaxID=2842247 RepID=A0A8S5L1G1_9VIRU|nr:hypothetical protein QII83_gp3 [ssRNA phage Zoerhiza.1_27]QDH87571.1 MAG: hypothetical protein H1Rhizo26FD374_000002 [Leviviridae sp.]DAD51263.1 TPA_asm: hypothetical protein [ssRNA phage Zoerhiza.1_27]